MCIRERRIVLTGRIQTGSYTNKDNIKVYTTEVIAEDIESQKAKRQQRDPAEQEDIKNRIRRKTMDL